jgi:hypothetical protein
MLKFKIMLPDCGKKLFGLPVGAGENALAEAGSHGEAFMWMGLRALL